MNKLLINYNNLYRYYEIENLNLKILEEKKERIRNKYFSITSSLTEKSSIIGANNDKYDNYMAELEKENLLDKIEEQKNFIRQLDYYKRKIEYELSQLIGIEHRLFYKVINGVNISKAVEEVVSENCCNNIKPQTTSVIWEKYYPNIKEEIRQFKNIQREIRTIYEKKEEI